MAPGRSIASFLGYVLLVAFFSTLVSCVDQDGLGDAGDLIAGVFSEDEMREALSDEERPAVACSSSYFCAPGQVCCEGFCVEGDCCESWECNGRVCADNWCAPCSENGDCLDGSICCGGLCREGACCDNADCRSGMVCSAGECISCVCDANCDAGQKCCDGRCVDGDCSVAGAFAACNEEDDCREHKKEGGDELTCWDGICISKIFLLTATPGKHCADQSDCSQGLRCCNQRCVIGDCCEDSECADPLQCLGYQCRTCLSDGMCGPNRVCCSGVCVDGECCPGSSCPGGQTCLSYQCSDCTNDNHCGPDRICCSGQCVRGDCCDKDDCGQYVCSTNNWCRTCQSHSECGSNAMCCGGACVDNATCCSHGDCHGAGICENNQCRSCTGDAECGFSQKCCDNINGTGKACYAGTCCSDADCIAEGRICLDNRCRGCSDDTQCPSGLRCCSGKCIAAQCCTDADCGGDLCINYSCEPCSQDGQCGAGQVCCEDMCYVGNCCNNDDCGSLVCNANHLCEPCTVDSNGNDTCDAGSKCCLGVCMAGHDCCLDADCGQGMYCDGGQCKTCTQDSDCRTGRCCFDQSGVGRCMTSCGGSVSYSTLDHFNRGTYDSTIADGDSCFPECRDRPGRLCWDGESQSNNNHYIWIPSTGTGQIYRYDVDTGHRVGPFNTGVPGNWPNQDGIVPGQQPSRTAVNPLDGTIWIANRGTIVGGAFDGLAPDSGVAHLSADGEMLCYYPIPGVARSAVVDANGDAWVGAFSTGIIYKLSGSSVDSGSTSSPPMCELLLTVSTGGNPYGAALDRNGLMWIRSGNGRVSIVDTRTGQFVQHVMTPTCNYGITADANAIWLGSYQDYSVGIIQRSNYSSSSIQFNPDVTPGDCSWGNDGMRPRGLAASPDGHIYAGLGPYGKVAKINPATLTYDIIGNQQGHTIATAVDSRGAIWAIDSNGTLDRIDPADHNSITRYTGVPGQHAYVYSDVTGTQVVNVGLTPGFWSVRYDSLTLNPRWKRIVIDSTEPPGTSVAVRFRTAPTLSSLDSADWTDYTRSFPVDMTTEPNIDFRFIEVELRLTTLDVDVTPVVDSVTIEWTNL